MKQKKAKLSSAQSKPRILITAALPYANGSIHLGHMVEYIQADIYSRALKLLGKNAVFVCADDTHGAPIEIKASQLGVKPEQLIEKYYKEHTKDFADFKIQFDTYYSTNSPENKKFSEHIFHELKKAGLIYTKEIPVIYCTHCKRFLPDRYVKGTCPKCKAPDQYGDVCEKCSSTHKTTELIDPKCATCGNPPVERTSEHYFFKLSEFSEKLKNYFATTEFQSEIINFVNPWLEELQDWCISRDGPYFGFKIPGEENKYFYVWLDAPVGYIAATEKYCQTSGENVETDYWKNPETKIIHFIGKDIVYFHFLFWPAMLMTAGFQLPNKIQVHGFLTVNKEKMSKSRGTFITARQYLDHLDPEYLRFYFAAHLGPTLSDLDFDANQFKERVNNELVANIANFCYRVLSFAVKHFDGKTIRYGEAPVSDVVVKCRECLVNTAAFYEAINFKDALQEILALSSLGNKYFQENEPWKLVQTDKQKAHEVISFCVQIIKNLSIVLVPILPEFSSKLQQQLFLEKLSWNDVGFDQESYTLQNVLPLIQKLEEQHHHLFVQKQEKKKEQGKVLPVLLKVGKIISVEDHPNAEKLYIEKIDLGNNEIRTIVSGIKQWYKKEELVGKHVLVVANLKPAKLRGVMSAGMILAAEHEGNLCVLEAPKSKIGEIVGIAGFSENTKEITYEEFSAVVFTLKNKKVLCNGHLLHAGKEEIHCDMPDEAKIK